MKEACLLEHQALSSSVGLADLVAAAGPRGLCPGQLVLWGAQSWTTPTQVGLGLFMRVTAPGDTLLMTVLAELKRRATASTRSMSQESTNR